MTDQDNPRMAHPVVSEIWRWLITPYTPDPTVDSYLERAQTQQGPLAEVTVAVLDAKESAGLFGVHAARRGVQPVYLRIANRSSSGLRLQLVSIDPNYYTPLEAAGVNHFSIVKRLSAFGLLGWMFLPLLPLLVLLPLKLITAYRANRRMDEFFSRHAFHLRPIGPGGTSEGFVFTPLDSGTKVVHVRLHATGGSLDSAIQTAEASAAGNPGAAQQEPASLAAAQAMAEFTFSLPVPGIAADYLRRDFNDIVPPDTVVACDARTLVGRLERMPAATTNAKALRTGDPVNLVIVGDFPRLISAFAARWDESETITLATCWKTMRAFLFGSDYRYSPVSPLHLFGRSQDVALQRTRRSINERLHLRLWLTRLCLQDQPVWVGQVSRDIGVRFTTKTWNLTTHRVDPDVDEARDYVIEDLLQAERIQAAGYVDGVTPCTREAPRRNLTGDPFFTDGKRAVILLSETRTQPRFVAWA
jgi:LssY C-terminus